MKGVLLWLVLRMPSIQRNTTVSRSCGMLISAVHTDKGEEKLNLLMVDDAIPAGAKLC